MTDDVVERWRSGEMSQKWLIDVSGTDAVVYAYADTRPGSWVKFDVTMVAVTVRWPIGGDEGSIRVAIWSRWTIGPTRLRKRPIELNPGMLREIPDWLSDLVLRATPRGIDWPEMQAHPKGQKT